jgi:hypothetical protein
MSTKEERHLESIVRKAALALLANDDAERNAEYAFEQKQLRDAAEAQKARVERHRRRHLDILGPFHDGLRIAIVERAGKIRESREAKENRDGPNGEQAGDPDLEA